MIKLKQIQNRTIQRSVISKVNQALQAYSR